MQDGLQVKKAGVIDIDHPYKGRIGDDEIVKKYQHVVIGLNGDFRLPLDLKAAVEQAGTDFLKYAEDNGIDLVQYGFDINGDGKVGPQEAGSGCTALALEHGKKDLRGKKDQVVSMFRPGCVFEVIRSLAPNPRVKGEDWRAAEQILGDTWPDQVSTPTNTAEADKAFLGRYSSGNANLLGGGGSDRR